MSHVRHRNHGTLVEETGALDPDPGAFSGFYEDAFPRIYGYFLHRCGGSVPLAEDLTQETFLAAVAELKKGRRVEAPIRWIYGIARLKLSTITAGGNESSMHRARPRSS
jgi:DNA-directed RNA polymerase specialized sigma24 family protein